MGVTSTSAGRHAYCDEESAARAAGVIVSRAAPGPAGVLGTRNGRLVAADFADPAWLGWVGVNRQTRFAATRDVQPRRPVAERVLAAARDAPPTRDAVIACRCWSLATDRWFVSDVVPFQVDRLR